MRIVIVARTRMGVGVCVGAMVEGSAKPVRILPRESACLKESAPFQVGDIWDMDVRPRARVIPPHVEDHDIVRRGEKVGEVGDIATWIRGKVTPWNGGPQALFDGTLQFRTTGAAYVPQAGPVPRHSTGFWTLPAGLMHAPYKADRVQHYYGLQGAWMLRVKYVGLPAPIPSIAAGTLVRVSLAHAWPGAPDPENRDKLFLQLSGWY